MPPTSDEELRELQEHVEDLRAQVVDANAEKEAYERSLANDTVAAQLGAEAARLEAELASIKNSRESSDAGGGASVPLDQATALMESALTTRDATVEAGEAAAEARAAADADAVTENAEAASATRVGSPPVTTTPTSTTTASGSSATPSPTGTGSTSVSPTSTGTEA